MSNKILVTDSLFIKAKHVKILEDAGFEVERLDVPKATEDELIASLKGKTGYIIGGVEKVTDKVFDSAEQLKAVAFTGTAALDFIPGNKTATKKGIAIANAPYFNAHSVAEFGITMSLAMTRNLIGLGRGSDKKFETNKTLSELKIGVLGLGHVGLEFIIMARGLGAKNISYFNRTKNTEIENKHGIKYLSKERLFKDCDLIFISISSEAGNKFVNKGNIDSMNKGSILVSIAHAGLIDTDALFTRLKSGEIRAALDEPLSDMKLKKLPLDVLYTPNESTAYNTSQNIEETSNSAVNSMINILKNGDDKFIVNPDFRKNT